MLADLTSFKFRVIAAIHFSAFVSAAADTTTNALFLRILSRRSFNVVSRRSAVVYRMCEPSFQMSATPWLEIVSFQQLQVHHVTVIDSYQFLERFIASDLPCLESISINL